MPHITIEHSANLTEHHDIQQLVDAVHGAALGHGLAPLDGLRTRAATRDRYRIADGDPDHAFVAITARIGPGRDAESKTSFLETILDAAEAQIDTAPDPLAIAWSAEIVEMDPSFRINRNHVRTRIAARRDGAAG